VIVRPLLLLMAAMMLLLCPTGFFWNMSITALAAALFMSAFMGYYKHSPMK
jgi:hypothetical protein